MEKRLSNGLRFNAGYTWSLARGIGGGEPGFPGAYGGQGGYNLGGEYGSLGWDRRHVFVAKCIWGLPFVKTGIGFVGKARGGWEVSGNHPDSDRTATDCGTAAL